ncbi:hypothetical protein BGX38DRAFT_1200588 [Terfezia claveryi]|nr:hypothetical protein BGX38DRAFT_1200588 [Terfezia claveryi]
MLASLMSITVLINLIVNASLFVLHNFFVILCPADLTIVCRHYCLLSLSALAVKSPLYFAVASLLLSVWGLFKPVKSPVYIDQ